MKHKFLLLPLAQQHKKCAEALQRRDFAAYEQFQTWLGLPPLEKTHEALSNRYHAHLQSAHLQVKEHRLLYPGNLKIWELGKEVPSNACPERVTIAERQGASEDKHLMEKPTKPKTKPSSWLGIVEEGDKETAEEVWPIAIYLDHLRSAHNVGSIVRTCEALSLGTLYFSPQTPTLSHPQVQKTAMGTADWVKGYPCDDLKQLPRPLIALETTQNAISLYDLSFPESFTLAIGNEEYGLSQETLLAADIHVRIPLRGRKNSLNVANAFAIAAAEIQRQRIGSTLRKCR